jgi:hypothetical protein
MPTRVAVWGAGHPLELEEALFCHTCLVSASDMYVISILPL